MSFFSKVKDKLKIGSKKDAASAPEAGAPGASDAEQPHEINPLDAQQEATQPKEDSSVIDNIVSTETQTEEQRILETAPDLDLSLLEQIEPPKSVLLVVLKVFLGLLLLASFASILFFTSQLSNRYDFINSTFGVENVSNLLTASNSEIISLKTDLNFYKFLQLKAYLDEFSYYGDQYIENYNVANSQTSSSNSKSAATEKLEELRPMLKAPFNEISKLVTNDIKVPLISTDYATESDLEIMFIQKLKEKLTSEGNKLKDADSEEAQREYRSYQHTSSLVGNSKIKGTVLSADFDALSESDLFFLIKDINNAFVNDLSVIQDIKEGRVKWSDVIDEINLRTKAIDRHFDEQFYDDLGGIRYSSYDFDADDRRISIIGETKSYSTKNFTLIADLIDELNSSGLFGNSEMKTFSKAGSLEDGYLASLKLTLDLREEENNNE